MATTVADEAIGYLDVLFFAEWCVRLAGWCVDRQDAPGTFTSRPVDPAELGADGRPLTSKSSSNGCARSGHSSAEVARTEAALDCLRSAGESERLMAAV
jgi:hypothetical protein